MNYPSTFVDRPSRSAERQEFYGRLDLKNTAPLWEVLNRLVTPCPQPNTVPAHWRWTDLRPLLIEAGHLITAKEAERRVLVLENPGLRNNPAYKSQITQSLYAGIQCITPGEVAPSHRHVASALRFVIEGDGAYTAVEGQRVQMRPGDFVVTPSWAYHDHGNDGAAPVMWLDGLDIPIVNTFDSSFAEHHSQASQPADVAAGPSTSVFSYPYERARAALVERHRSMPIHLCHGVKQQYLDSVTGASPMPTIGAFLQLLPRGFRSLAYRSTDATVFCIAEGRGYSRVGDQTFDWDLHDVFVVPSWTAVSHAAAEEAVLFSFSDRPAQEALGLWREEELS
jgi:gentisate 1,2-dioxygenase